MAGRSSTADQLAGKLDQRAASAANAPAVSPANTIAAYLKKMEGEISRALPKHMTPERMSRIALTTIRTNPKLLDCNVPSLMAAVMQAAQLGLEPGLIGHCYIIPYGKEATFIIGYKGMIDLARRSGQIQSINAHVVYDHDFIELEYGLEDKLKHIPWHLRSDKDVKESGSIKGAYMVAKFKDGGHQIHYMPYSDILKHRDRSAGYTNAKKYNRTDNPWITDEEEMCKKTVVRSGWKFLPISVEIANAVNKDETSHNDISDIADDSIIDITANVSEDPAPSGSSAQDELQFEQG